MRDRDPLFGWQRRTAKSLLRQHGDGAVSYSWPWDWGNWFRWFKDDEFYPRANTRFVTKWGVTLLIDYNPLTNTKDKQAA